MLATLQHNPMFAPFHDDEIKRLLEALKAHAVVYQKHEQIIAPQQVIEAFGIVLRGSIYVYDLDYDGNTLLLAKFSRNEVFAETFSIAKQAASVYVASNEESEIVWLNYHAMLASSIDEKIKTRFTQQLLIRFAKKNLFLTSRMNHLSKKSIRDKVLSYLLEESAKQQSKQIHIPFDRQKMADYLSVERSALSYVLSQLKKEGVIAYHKNEFTLL